jgi:heptosyltransferase-2
VWLVGSAKDAAITAEIARLMGGHAVDLAGRTSLDEAIDLMSFAARVVTNDSGLMHVAAALDRPTAAIFGSSSPKFTPPLSPHARVVSLQLSCSPCFARVCPLGHTNCLATLAPARVIQVMEWPT